MKKDLVSVIVPVYNVEAYLSKSLDSIIAQTYSNIEIILVDDGSKDASGKICDEYAARDSRIRVLHKKNGGVSRARNDALKMVQGEYFTFVDGDDVIEPTYIELMVYELKNNEVELVRLSWRRGGKDCTYFTQFDNHGRRFVDASNLNDLLLFANIWGLFKSEYIPFIHFDEEMKYAEDNLFLLEYFLKTKTKKMLLINKPYYHYTIVGNSATQIDVFERVKRSEMFVERVLKLNDLEVDLKRLTDKYLYKDYLVLLYHFIDLNEKERNGINIDKLKLKIKGLRKNGCREYSLQASVVSFLYRNHLHFLMSFFRKIRSVI